MNYYYLRRKRKNQAEGSNNWQWYVFSGSGKGSWARKFTQYCLFDEKEYESLRSVKEARTKNPGCEMVLVRIVL